MPSFTYSTSTVTIGYSTKKSDFDQLLNNIRHVKSGTCTFSDAKTFSGTVTFNSTTLFKNKATFTATALFHSKTIFSGQNTFNSASVFIKKTTFTATAIFTTTPLVNTIKSRTATSGIASDITYVSGTVNYKKIFKQYFVAIGSWDMDSVSAISIGIGKFGLTTATISKLNIVSVTINGDSGIDQNMSLLRRSTTLIGECSGYWYVDVANGNIRLARAAGSEFDSTDFNSTSVNRGYVYAFVEQ